MTKGKNKKIKPTKIFYFCCHPFALSNPPPPTPQLFSRQKFLKIDTWVSGQAFIKVSRRFRRQCGIRFVKSENT